MTRAVLAAATAALVIASARPAPASPLDLFGFGGRSPGMAATGVATSDDFDSVYLNPAGLAEAGRKRLTFGFLYGDFALEMGERDTGTEPAVGVLIGGALPIPLGGALRDRVVFGLGLYVPTETINRARQPLPGVPIFSLLETRSHVVALQTGAGVRLADGWSAGASVLALAALDGGIDVSTDAAGRFTTTSQQQLIARFTPILGLRRSAGRLRLGLTFRGTSRSDYDIEVTNDLQDELPLTIPTLRIAGTAQYDPLTVAAEATWGFTPALDATVHLSYQRWSAFPAPTVTPVESAPPVEDPGFHDIVVPRTSIEWRARHGSTRIAARGGYAFHLSPAPEMDGRQSLLDNHRHVLAAGLGLSWPGAYAPLHLDLWMQGHLLAPRRHTKDVDLFTEGEQIPFYTLDTGGHILVGGLTLGVDI